jgi:molybdopterin-guanine dinucleotide biosynthesis protein A
LAAEARLAAIVLAGGQARRLGGIDKPGLRLGPQSLAAAVAGAAMLAGAVRVVVVGPHRPELIDELARAGSGVGSAQIEFAREQPPGAGPVPALRAGISRVAEPWLLLLAADLPFLTVAALRELVEAAGPRGGAVAADRQGRPQWLVSCWRTAGLRDVLPGYTGTSLRGLLAPLPHVDMPAVAVPGEPPYWLDCDTPEDLETAERLGRHSLSKEQP